MSSSALELQRPHEIQQRPQTAIDIRAQVNLIQEVMRAVMKEGIHYGTIPGCQKPTLYKAGSEILLSTFRIAVDPVVEDLSTPDTAHFRVSIRATSMAGGNFLGSGVGEASSDEEKYKWREVVCDEEWNATPEDRKRMKYKKGRGGSAYSVRQVRTEKADVANTILKMAKKRSQIDVTLTVTAASDIFAQDIEDLPEELRPEMSDEHTTTNGAAVAQMPQRKSTPAPQPVTAQPTSTIEGKPCPDCGEHMGPRGCNSCGWMPDDPTPVAQPAQPQRAATPVPRPQPHAPQGELISEAQGKRFFAIAMSNGKTRDEQTAYLKQTWGISSSKEITKPIYEQCCAWAEGK